MSDKIDPSIASAVNEVIEERKEEGRSAFQYQCTNIDCGNEYPPGVHGSPVCSTCGSKMKIHQHDLTNKPREEIKGLDDILVALGDLSSAEVSQITAGKNFEAIALDYIATFNGAVTQGVSPLKALMAMTQATAIVMGLCLRAGLKQGIAFGFVAQIIKKIRQTESEVRIVTSTTEH